jgi:hypothetical protein
LLFQDKNDTNNTLNITVLGLYSNPLPSCEGIGKAYLPVASVSTVNAPDFVEMGEEEGKGGAGFKRLVSVGN